MLAVWIEHCELWGANYAISEIWRTTNLIWPSCYIHLIVSDIVEMLLLRWHSCNYANLYARIFVLFVGSFVPQSFCMQVYLSTCDSSWKQSCLFIAELLQHCFPPSFLILLCRIVFYFRLVSIWLYCHFFSWCCMDYYCRLQWYTRFQFFPG